MQLPHLTAIRINKNDLGTNTICIRLKIVTRIKQRFNVVLKEIKFNKMCVEGVGKDVPKPVARVLMPPTQVGLPCTPFFKAGDLIFAIAAF